MAITTSYLISVMRPQSDLPKTLLKLYKYILGAGLGTNTILLTYPDVCRSLTPYFELISSILFLFSLFNNCSSYCNYISALFKLIRSS